MPRLASAVLRRRECLHVLCLIPLSFRLLQSEYNDVRAKNCMLGMSVEMFLSIALPLRCAETSRMGDRPICRDVKPGHDCCNYLEADHRDGGTRQASHQELRRLVPEFREVNGSPSIMDPSPVHRLTQIAPNTTSRATDRQNSTVRKVLLKRTSSPAHFRLLRMSASEGAWFGAASGVTQLTWSHANHSRSDTG